MEHIRTDIMGMPIRIVIARDEVDEGIFTEAFTRLEEIDERFSTYKETSEISRINRGEVLEGQWSADMKDVFALAEKTKKETDGFFDIRTPEGTIDPSGVVKGWAIQTVFGSLLTKGEVNILVDIAGDVATHGVNENGEDWAIGIKNPFNTEEIVKIVYPKGRGVATSGQYERGAHIYNPISKEEASSTLESVTVVAPTILEADLLATATFAMGEQGLTYVQKISGVEVYAIRKDRTSVMTPGFSALTIL
jgi:FAD:protein FMN transferase